ncbi:MAG: TIGR04279 domain-containing protein [Candidatus Bathyarchaeota archaeon]|jgi:methanogen extracellular protein (TIGR04279 family)
MFRPAQATSPSYPVDVTVSPSSDYNNIIVATHGDELTDGNWIELGGGESIEIPALSLELSVPNTAAYVRENTTITVASGYTSKEINYPLDTHRAYIEGEEINGTFWGSSGFSGVTIDLRLLRLSSYTEFRNLLRDTYRGNLGDLRGKLSSPYWSASKILDFNGDAVFTISPNPEAGDYILIASREVGGSYPKDLYLYSATFVEVLERSCNVTAVSSVDRDEFLDVDIEISGGGGSFTYGAALIQKSAYTMNFRLTSDGHRDDTELYLNEALVGNGSLAGSFLSGSRGVSYFTLSYIIQTLRAVFGSKSISVGIAQSTSTTGSTSLATSNLRGGEYVLIAVVWEGYVDRLVAFNQSTVTIKAPPETPVVVGPPTPSPEEIEALPPEEAAEVFDALPTDTAASLLMRVNISTAAAIMERTSVTVSAEIMERVNISTAVALIGRTPTIVTANIMERINVSTAAAIIEVTPIDLSVSIIDKINHTQASSILERTSTDTAASIIEGISTEKATQVVEMMEIQTASTILSKAQVQASSKIYEELEHTNEENAGALIQAAVQTNNTENFADILLAASDNATSGGLLMTDAESGATVVRAMAEKNLHKAASKVEAMIKHRVRELAPTKQQELLDKAADILENISADALVAIFIEIAGLPETPLTVAEAMEAMNIDKVTETVSTWISTGAYYELVDVFVHLSDETLKTVWVGLPSQKRTIIRPYLSLETRTRLSGLPEVGKPKLVVQIKGAHSSDEELKAAMADMPQVKWSVVYGDITVSDIEDASMLIMVMSDAWLEYTEAELRTIKNWYDEGGKSIWVASDSDFGSDALRQHEANIVLEYIGSSLRIESASTEDPVSNGYAPYRVLGVSDHVAPEFQFLVSGVDRALFHGPGTIIGYKDGHYVALEDGELENAYVIMTTSIYGVVLDRTDPAPEVHQAGEKGPYPVMAIEIDDEKSNVIIATGDAPFGHYIGMYKPELKKPERYNPDVNPQQGSRLFENIVDYVTQYSGLLIESTKAIQNKDAEISILQEEVSRLQIEIEPLETTIPRLRNEISSLENKITDLETQITEKEGQIDGLESTISTLNEGIAASKRSARSWRIYMMMLLVIGLVAGYYARDWEKIVDRAREKYPRLIETIRGNV